MILKLFFIAIMLTPIYAQAIKVEGTIYDENGNGLSGVSVSIEGASNAPVYTDQSGKFVIYISDETYSIGGTIFFQLFKKGYQISNEDNLRKNVPNSEIATSALIFHMKKIKVNEKIKISGYVENVNHVLIKDVIVIMCEENQTAKTDSLGHFEIFASKKRVNTNVTFRTHIQNYFSEPLTYSVTYDPKPAYIYLTKDSNSFYNPIKIGAQNNEARNKTEGLNFFKSESDPIYWLDRSRVFNLAINDNNFTDFHFTRYYSSKYNQSITRCGLGFGWYHSYEKEILLKESTLENIILKNFDGNFFNFSPSTSIDSIISSIKFYIPSISKKTPLSEVFQLISESDRNSLFEILSKIIFIGKNPIIGQLKIIPRGFQVYEELKTYYLYDNLGVLESIEEKEKNPIRLFHDIDGELEGIKVGDKITRFFYNKYRLLNSILYSDGSKRKFVYDTAKGLLTQIRLNNSNEYFYNYDSSYRIIQIRDFVNNDTIRIRYDKNGNKILIFNKNKSISFSYNFGIDTVEVLQTIRYKTLDIMEENNDDVTPHVIQYKYPRNGNELLFRDKTKNYSKKFKIASCCNTLEVSTDKSIEKYEYNFLGQLIKIIKDSIEIKYHYILQTNNIDTIETINRKHNKTVDKKIYNYNSDGLLKNAYAINGTSIIFNYLKENILELNIMDTTNKENPKRIISYKYDEQKALVFIEFENGEKYTVNDLKTDVVILRKVYQKIKVLFYFINPINNPIDIDYEIIDK